MNQENPFLSSSQLKERGWTPALITQFLGEPDATKPNPHYRAAAPMRLYARARVEVAEQFVQAAAKAQARSQTGKMVAARKAAELVAQAEQTPIRVKRLPFEQVQDQAIASYNAFHEELLWERGHDYNPAHLDSDPAFLDRITVNYIRHALTEYDTHLEAVAGKVGVSEAVATIRRRIFAEIAHAYPEYTQECHRQVATRAAPVES